MDNQPATPVPVPEKDRISLLDHVLGRLLGGSEACQAGNIPHAALILTLKAPSSCFIALRTALRIVRPLRAACSDPFTASGLPSLANRTDAPNTRVSPTPERPEVHQDRRAPPYDSKKDPLDLHSGFRPRRSHLACSQRRELRHSHHYSGPDQPDRDHRPCRQQQTPD